MTYRKLSNKLALGFIGLSMGLGLAAAGATAAESVSPAIPQIDWDTSLNKFQFDSDKFVGQRFTAECVHRSKTKKNTVVQGTDVYTSKSSICLAALHAGKIAEEGGVVTVQLNPGEESYTGSDRNGVQSATLPGTKRSIVFVDATTAAVADPIHLSHIPRIDWDTRFTRTGYAHKQLVGQRFAFNCPAAPNYLRSRRVIGTDSYAFKAMICRAAVHAGKITTEGGIVTVQMDPAADGKLFGSIRNGIETVDGPGGIRTISFVDQPANS